MNRKLKSKPSEKINIYGQDLKLSKEKSDIKRLFVQLLSSLRSIWGKTNDHLGTEFSVILVLVGVRFGSLAKLTISENNDYFW